MHIFDIYMALWDIRVKCAKCNIEIYGCFLENRATATSEVQMYLGSCVQDHGQEHTILGVVLKHQKSSNEGAWKQEELLSLGVHCSFQVMDDNFEPELSKTRLPSTS